MSLVIKQPTANETPDSGQGGLAVTGITTTGHGSTITGSAAFASAGFGSAGDSDSKSARWFGLQQIVGQRTSVRLKFAWTASGNANANDGGGGGTASSSCSFQIQYSLNGGGNWITHASDSAFASAPGGSVGSFTNNNSADIVLSNVQDISQIQVRSLYQTSANANGGEFMGSDASSDVSVSVSGIQVEVTTVDAGVIVVM